MVNEISPGRDLFKTTLAHLATLAALSSVSAAAAACQDLTMAPGGTVVQVTDGDTIVLDDGRIIRMIGTQAPKLALGRDDFDPWPLAEPSKRALSDMVLGKTVELGFSGERQDRHGRVLAHVLLDTPDGPLWAQQAMVAKGLARVYSFPDNRTCLDLLFAAEGRARVSGLGIWSDPYYSVRLADQPDALLARVGHYELVEGRILKAESRSGRVYFNFGRSWKLDFTAVIEAPALRLFAADGRDPLVLDGALVRIRGWVDDRDGPRIEITHPEQIEVLATR